MHHIQLCETPDGYEVMVLNVVGYVVEPEVFATEQEAEAWMVKIVAGYEIEEENPPEPPQGYHFADKDGGSELICRAEFVLIGEGVYQFNLWSEQRRLHTEVGHIDDLDEHLRLTALLMDSECKLNQDRLENGDACGHSQR